MKTIAIAGSGFSGAVIARQLADAGYMIEVFESRPHVAGNCFTERHSSTGIMLHKYGPHIFHTSNKTVWDYIQRFGEFVPFINRVKAVSGGRIYSLPINLMTINSFFGTVMSPKEAQDYLNELSLGDPGVEPENFEQQALKFVGKELYEAFFRGYTLKQWGVEPSSLPASILKRLPVRFDYNDNYYTSAFQGVPRAGYTSIVESLLDHHRIKVYLNQAFDRSWAEGYKHVFFSGPIDHWFGMDMGYLGYRTLDFKEEVHLGDYQGNAVVNYCNLEVPWTRVSEHKHFSPWEQHERTLIYKEYSRDYMPGDTPYYPLRLVNERALLARYVERARAQAGVTFVGRLGTYRYLDMHVTIEEALKTSEEFILAEQRGEPMPSFVVDPLGA